MQVSSLPGLRQSWKGREQALMETRLCQTLYPGHYISNAHRSPVRDTDFSPWWCNPGSKRWSPYSMCRGGKLKIWDEIQAGPQINPKTINVNTGACCLSFHEEAISAFGQLTNSFGQFQWPKGMSKPNQDKVTYNSYSLFTSPFPVWNIYNILLYINIKVYIIYFNLKGKNTINK